MPIGPRLKVLPGWASRSRPPISRSLDTQPRACREHGEKEVLFIGDGAFQMTAQELSTILRRGLKPIIFLVNNNGYTIERLILGPGSSFNDINQWRYAEAVSFFDTQNQAIAYRVRTEDEMEDAAHCLGFHKSAKVAPTAKPSTGANPELPIRIAQPRLRVPALEHP
jgi:indolepyruvate decarboxylase